MAGQQACRRAGSISGMWACPSTPRHATPRRATPRVAAAAVLVRRATGGGPKFVLVVRRALVSVGTLLPPSAPEPLAHVDRVRAARGLPCARPALRAACPARGLPCALPGPEGRGPRPGREGSQLPISLPLPAPAFSQTLQTTFPNTSAGLKL